MVYGGIGLNPTFSMVWEKQQTNQQIMTDLGMYDGFMLGMEEGPVLPADVPSMFSYQVQGEMSELGELLEADKRWKNMRNGHFDASEKLEELADCFIYLMNIAVWSGYTREDVLNAIESKVQTVRSRIREESRTNDFLD